MPFNVFGYFYDKPRRNPNYGTDPNEPPLIRPSFGNWLLDPTSARRTAAYNQQFMLRPEEAAQDTRIMQSELPTREALATTIMEQQHPKRSLIERIERTKDAVQAAADKFNLAKQYVGDPLRKRLGIPYEETYAMTGGTPISPAEMNQMRTDLTYGAGGAPEMAGETKAGVVSDVLAEQNLRRSLGLMPQALMNEREQGLLTGEQIAGERKLLPARIGVADLSLENQYNTLPLEGELRANDLRAALGRQGFETARAADEANRNAQIARAELGLTGTDIDTLKKRTALSNVATSAGGVMPQDIPGQPYVTTVGPNGDVTVNYGPGMEGKMAQMQTAVADKMAGTRKVVDATTGRVAPTPPPPAVLQRQAGGFLPPAQKALQRQESIKEMTPSEQAAVKVEPAKPWDMLYDSVIEHIYKSPTSLQIKAGAQKHAVTAFIEELANVVKLPEQFVGSSNVRRSKVAVLKELLANPATAAQIEEQVNALPPEVLEGIKKRVMKRVDYVL